MSRFRAIFLLAIAGVPVLAWGAPVTRFIVTGDSRGGDNGINSYILSQMVTAIWAEDPDLVIFSGDLTNDGTQAQLTYWVQRFMLPLAAAGIRVYPCRGNHDRILEAWNTVMGGMLPGNGPPGEEYVNYSVEYDNALFVLLEGLMVNQAYVDGLLAANTKPHVFVCHHLPAFSVQHGDCLELFPAARDTFWDSIGAAGGRVYFTGHDHFYDHARIPDSTGNPIEQYVVGTAGAPLYAWEGEYGEARVQPVAHYMNYGYVVVDIDGGNVRLTYKQLVDEGVFEETDDVFTYSVPVPVEELPGPGRFGLGAIVVIVPVVFALLAFRSRRVYLMDGTTRSGP